LASRIGLVSVVMIVTLADGDRGDLLDAPASSNESGLFDPAA